MRDATTTITIVPALTAAPSAAPLAAQANSSVNAAPVNDNQPSVNADAGALAARAAAYKVKEQLECFSFVKGVTQVFPVSENKVVAAELNFIDEKSARNFYKAAVDLAILNEQLKKDERLEKQFRMIPQTQIYGNTITIFRTEKTAWNDTNTNVKRTDKKTDGEKNTNLDAKDAALGRNAGGLDVNAIMALTLLLAPLAPACPHLIMVPPMGISGEVQAEVAYTALRAISFFVQVYNGNFPKVIFDYFTREEKNAILGDRGFFKDGPLYTAYRLDGGELSQGAENSCCVVA